MPQQPPPTRTPDLPDLPPPPPPVGALAWWRWTITVLRAGTGLRLRQLLAELRGRVTAAIPRTALVFLTPVVVVEPPPEPTPWDPDYWLRRFPDHEQA